MDCGNIKGSRAAHRWRMSTEAASDRWGERELREQLGAGPGGLAITAIALAGYIPNPAYVLSRTDLRAGFRILLRVRAIDLRLRRAGANNNANWHSACVIAWQFWNAPSNQAHLLRRLQARRWGQTAARLWKSAEVDHGVLLFRVWREHRDAPWPELLYYWGLPNLQVINRNIRSAKCANEARDGKAARSMTRLIAVMFFLGGEWSREITEIDNSVAKSGDCLLVRQHRRYGVQIGAV
jgi:hypothetical protein